MSRPLAVVLVLALTLLALAAMWWGWRRRERRTGVGLAPATAAGPGPRGAATLVARGVYVSSTTAGDWLDRVNARGLGVRSPVTVEVAPDGVRMLRRGAPDVLVPAADLRGARRERGIAGKVTEPGGIVVVRWRSGTALLDTGIRTRYRADRDRLVDAVNAITPGAKELHGADTRATEPGDDA